MEGIVALEKRVRSPVVDGLFYPADTAGVLAYMYGIGLEPGKGGFARAIVAPHGAWEISGTLAGAAFAAAGGRTGGESPSRVVILGPVHDREVEGIFLSNSHSFQTALGDISVDLEASRWLESCSSLFEINDIPHLREHSIEVLLPFVKFFFPHAEIVPVLMGKPKEPYISALAHALQVVFAPVVRDTLFVVSFNMAAPLDDFSGANSEVVFAGKAAECRRLFNAGNHADLEATFRNGNIFGCGGALITSLLNSGLVNKAHPCLASRTILSAMSEKNRPVYYGAFSFE